MDYLLFKELTHSGVKGMKWGVRNYQNEDGTLTESGKARYNPDGSRKKSKNMSDEDLRRSSNRLQAEQNYDRLSETKGERAAKNALRIGASMTGSFLLSSGSVLVADAITKKSLSFGKETVAKALIVGGLTSAGALVTGLVSSAGGTINNSVESKYYQNGKKNKK